MNRFSAIAFLGGLLALSLAQTGCKSLDEYPEQACLEPGAEDCECGAGGRCNLLPDGTRLACIDAVCERPVCAETGAMEEGCLCGGTQVCEDDLVCNNGTCQVDSGQTLTAPAHPVCYTPCLGGGYTDDDGTYHACDSDGLVEGCIDKATCVEGSCVVPETRTSTTCSGSDCAMECEVDGDCESGFICDDSMCIADPLLVTYKQAECDENDDCPSHQNCVAGQCYSDCEDSADCRPGRQCYRKACRVACDGTDAAVCPEGTLCNTLDGQVGFCLPIGVDTTPSTTNEAESASTAGNFEETDTGEIGLEPSILPLSPSQTDGTIAITNGSDRPRCFSVDRKAHTEYSDGNSSLITEFPLHWISLSTDAGGGEDCGGAAESSDSLTFSLEAGEAATITLEGAENETLKRWDGELQVSSAGLPPQRIGLSYTGTAEGQWVGKVYYFGSFGTLGLQSWLDSNRNSSQLGAVGNALLRRWGAVRTGQLSIAEFRAALDQTVTGQWRSPSLKARCPSADAPNPNTACYLYNNADGLSIYSDFTPDNPVPSGVTEFPLAMNVHVTPGEGPGVWSGKIVSSKTLHYAGDPAIALSFESDPSQCPSSSDSCVHLLKDLNSTTLVGGRYIAEATDPYCAHATKDTFERSQVPWLVPGFVQGTETDSDGKRYRFECRDTLLPFGLSGRGNGQNESLAASNPIPDGRPRKRTLELIDGALIDQENLLIFFRESFPSFMGSDDEDFASYGVMNLTLSPTRLDPNDYAGSKQEDDRVPVGLPALACDDDTLDDINSGLSDLDSSDRGIALVTGQMPSADPPVELSTAAFEASVDNPDVLVVPDDSERAHYLCEDTNVFDAGADGGTPCPDGSTVAYFTLQGAGAAQSAINAESCNLCPLEDRDRCGCDRTLQSWMQNGTHELRLNPVSRCTDTSLISCSDDRYDLRDGKTFFKASDTSAFSKPIDQLVADAFRYKTKFKNRDGVGVGFTPEVCSHIPGKTPYCYDPAAIEKLRQRIDCIVRDYVDPAERSARESEINGNDANRVMRNFLERSFSYSEEFRDNAAPLVHDGFERLYAELLVMLGDESVTGAFASRFDLADTRVATFEGDKFEPGGILLPGGGGFEMYSLYQATQYYQLALDRFYRLSPAIWEAIGRLPAADAFIGAASVNSYFSRLGNASTAKALASSQIAKRYQTRNRPDLARHVLERAYTSSHLEATVLTRMMQRTEQLADATEQTSITYDVEAVQRRYTRALSNMREVYDGLTDEVTYFGFPSDYIPFPVLYRFDTNAFEKSLARARQSIDVAKEKEARALADDRSFETSAAEFQSQLATISRDYDGRLGAICGTFQADFGSGNTSVYPATNEFAELLPGIPAGTNPCGLVGNGELNDAQLRYQQAEARFNATNLSYQNVLKDIDDANAKTVEQCGRIGDLASMERRTRNTITTLNTVVASVNEAMAAVQRQFDVIARTAATSKCVIIAGLAGGTDCPIAIVGAATTATSGTIMNVVNTTLAAGGIATRHVISDMETELAVANINSQCEAMEIDTKYQVAQLFRRTDEIGVEIFSVAKDVELTLANIRRLQNEAARLEADQQETTELAVNVEAARNDPNVRIYRNDAILEADRTYEEARREAFRATKVFEYFTSQSYPKLESLLDVRMVSHGSYTLEAYLSELNEAFYQFQEAYGDQNHRLEIVSIRDDVFSVDSLTTDATSESISARREAFQEKLQSSLLLDAQGYRRIPFSVDLARLSPATRNHKIKHIEIEVLSNTQKTETISRFYLEQAGTSTVQGLDDELSFYSLPKRTAVVELFFNNTRFFDPEIYQSDVLRDRPLVNTRWDLVINTKDEAANEDLDLSQITDIRIHFHYTDFVAQ